MLKIKDMNLNNVIRQGDSQPREYQLDTGNLDLNLTNKSATIRLMTADFQGIGYETTATVSSENKISFSIDDVIPARQYRLEVTVDDYVFPSRATDGQFNIDPSSHGQDVNIINVIGKEEIVRDVKARVENELEPLVTSLESAQQAESDRQAQEEARETAEGERQEEYQKYGQQFTDVITELTEERDFDSAPEIVAARRGKPSLGAKIDDITSQLAQTKQNKLDKNSGAVTSADLSQEVKEQMTGGSVAVVGVNSVLESNVVDKQITPRKTSFLKQSTNLLDVNASVANKSINTSTGALVDTPGTHMVELVVSPGEVYSRANTSRFFLYKSDGTYRSSNINTTYTMPSDIGFIRLTFTDAERETAQLNRGSDVLPYEKPGVTLKDEVNVPIKPKSVTEDKLADNSVGVAKLKSHSVDSLKLQNGAVSIEKTNFMGRSSNLYDPRTSLRGYGLLKDTGEPYEDPYFVSTTFYEGLAGEKITTKQFNRVLFYRSDKTFISRTDFITSYTFTMPQDGFFRLHGHTGDVDDKAQINKGDALLPYEPYYLIIDGYKFEGDVDPESTTNPPEEKPYIFPPVDFDTTFKANDGTYTTFTLENLYAAYDELATAHPGYFTKTLIGKEQSGQYDVFKCSMKPKEYSRNGSVRGKLPKITFIANIHGGEHPSALATYYMVRAICEDWRTNETLEFLRHNVEFEFIPVANPYGYVTGAYKNSRGVNIQTNLPENWELRDNTDPDSSTYGGEEPLSEVESLYIKDLIDDNTDSMLFSDLHSANYVPDMWEGGYDSFFYYIIPSGSQYNKNVEVATKYLAESNTRFLKKYYPINTDNLLGFYQLREGKGTVDSYAAGVKGIPSVLIELFYKLPDETGNYSSDSIKASTEVLTNSLLTMLKQFKEAGQ